jgi:D-xylose 1-dehydrogenase (NADP+, D-xylono-1,5-lactone-forming)
VIRWGVLGATSRIHRQRLRPAIALAGQRIVAEGSSRGEDLSAYDDVLSDANVEAVYIPLPNSLHVEWVTKALAAGKHVLCEKPLAMSGTDAETLYAAARSAGRHLSEAYVWPHHPRSQRLLELVATGEFGTLQSHHATFSFVVDAGDHRLDGRGGGALFDVGIYCLGPPLLMSGGDPGPVAATATRNDADVDVAMSGWIELTVGTVATFAVSFDAPARRHQELVGADALTVIESVLPGPERPDTLSILRRDGTRDHVDHPGANPYERMVTAFAAEVAGEAEPRWTATDSIRLAHLLDRLHAASRTPSRSAPRPRTRRHRGDAPVTSDR